MAPISTFIETELPVSWPAMSVVGIYVNDQGKMFVKLKGMECAPLYIAPAEFCK